MKRASRKEVHVKESSIAVCFDAFALFYTQSNLHNSRQIGSTRRRNRCESCELSKLHLMMVGCS
ncbi:hypothetical protein OIU77_020412 [Salix suchowensis]|uniref:Uncharacterized protein n=1 Tax=Salix suchowensis TaxID=1278906 RepID=A0ABQ9C9M0_9ROSI|nr:hypothetical protein OIU77_020412 [Salix suchowensis]